MIWLIGQAVKTPPSHGGIRGSIPLSAAKKDRVNRHFKFTDDKEVSGPVSRVNLKKGK